MPAVIGQGAGSFAEGVRMALLAASHDAVLVFVGTWEPSTLSVEAAICFPWSWYNYQPNDADAKAASSRACPSHGSARHGGHLAQLGSDGGHDARSHTLPPLLPSSTYLLPSHATLGYPPGDHADNLKLKLATTTTPVRREEGNRCRDQRFPSLIPGSYRTVSTKVPRLGGGWDRTACSARRLSAIRRSAVEREGRAPWAKYTHGVAGGVEGFTQPAQPRLFLHCPRRCAVPRLWSRVNPHTHTHIHTQHDHRSRLSMDRHGTFVCLPHFPHYRSGQIVSRP